MFRVGDRVKVIGIDKDNPYSSEELREFENTLIGEIGYIVNIWDPREITKNSRNYEIEFEDDYVQDINSEIGNIIMRGRDLQLL